MKTVIVLFVLNILFSPDLATACDHDDPLAMIAMEHNIVGDRIYLDPSQVMVSNEGIYFFVNGHQAFTEKIAWDENGIYCLVEDLGMDSISDRCRMGHRVWCSRCWGCVIRDCPYHCSCMAWP
ncbi:MAG: hypothetical protein Q8K75_03090 [Chlamydiales bacterium]|nr:hypothetical protein [Chlamydiales bacterium]